MRIKLVLSLLLATLICSPVFLPSVALARDSGQSGFFSNLLDSSDDDDKKQEERGEGREAGERTMGMLPVQAGVYTEECGSCHFPFQADLLPKRSWEKILAHLDSHFGDDAQMDPASLKKVSAYLLKNAGDYSHSSKIQRILSSQRSMTLIRISESPFFKREHRKISKRVLNRDSIKSFSNCSACHTSAKAGDYTEDNISIPR